MRVILHTSILAVLALALAACSVVLTPLQAPGPASAGAEPGAPASCSPSPAASPAPTNTATATPAPTATATPTSPPTATPSPSPSPTRAPTRAPSPAPSNTLPPEERWVEVILSQQILIAWEGQREVRRMRVSTGKAQTPTVTGTFRIYGKLLKQTMTGADYTQPDVPYVMYFYRDYAIHGCYWHSNFGTPMSHGCINLSLPDAAWLFDWAGPRLPAGATVVWAFPANPGTLVVVHA